MRMLIAIVGVIGAFGVMCEDVAAQDSDLAARADAWQTAFNAGELAGVAALYAEDGCRMPPNAAMLSGREAIVANLQATRDAGVAEIALTVTVDETEGDMAHGTGTYELTASDGSHVDHGKWMNVSKRVGGEWTIQCDIWNSDMPLPTP